MRGARSHLAQKNLPLQLRQGVLTKPCPQPSSAKSTARDSLSGRPHVGEEGCPETKPRGTVTPTGSLPTLRQGGESGDWNARRSTRPSSCPEQNLEFGPKSGQSGGGAKAVNHPSMVTCKAHAHSLPRKRTSSPGFSVHRDGASIRPDSLDFLPERDMVWRPNSTPLTPVHSRVGQAGFFRSSMARFSLRLRA